MDHTRQSIEFESRVDGHGKITVPRSILAQLGRGSGSIRVRLTSKVISSALKKRNVEEEEIERIATLQLESREQVVKFLLSERVLQGHTAFKQRAEGFAGGTRH